ncbi:MAG: BT_3928 family protein [Bacteroidales bacterium]
MKAISNIFRIIIGIVFVFSGFVKVVDPMGVQFKFIDYFNAMGLEFLQPAALTFGVILSVAELLLGISLLFNLKPRLGAWGVMLFMAVFLPLTLWIAIANPVQDCGCFGDAIILSNWATFWKNVIIMFLVVVVFLQRNKFKPLMPGGFQVFLLFVFAAGTIWISVHSIRHLPLVDFRPYSIGENIQAGMEVPESEKDNMPEYETIIVYENKNTGELKEFDVDNLPENENEWEWHETKNELVKEGYTPPIHDFSITTMPLDYDAGKAAEEISQEKLFEITYRFEADGMEDEFFIDNLPSEDNWQFVAVNADVQVRPENLGLIYEKEGETREFTLFDLPDEDWMFVDAVYYNDASNLQGEPDAPEDVTDLVLNDDRYTFFITSWDVTSAKRKHIEELKNLHGYCETKDYPFLFITASTEEVVKEFVEETDVSFDFYNMDPITIKTIVRSNPGIILLKNGTILNKWHINDVPVVDELDERLLAQSMQKQVKKSNLNLYLWLSLCMFLIVALSHLLVNYLKKKHIILDKKSWR